MTRLALIALVALAACSGGDDPDPDAATAVVVENDALCLDAPREERPVVDLIAPAMAAVDDLYGAPQRYFEVSADRQRVSLVVARGDGTAEQVFYCGEAGRTPAEGLGEATGATFPSGAVTFDPDTIFGGIDTELDDPEIVDFAIVGAGDDQVVYDATVQSDSGGAIVVMLSGDGAVQAVQAQ